MNEVYLQLGSNIGDRLDNLDQSIKIITERIGNVLEKSSVYESTPWGVENQRNFLNQVIFVKSNFDPYTILDLVLQIEKDMGRIRIEKWGERIIDIDILFIDDLIIESENLCIPHEFIAKRKFVLQPMCEIAPGFIHPKLNKTISQLLEECIDEEKVNVYAT
jgi:2-amino-4-hydroxy-6-hydroxymethyldihydropteridine diphosphokinase|tara:strand:- start:2034 stop:2519 length:486 start_codon:yes stop_codon:yes gene_type:complete